MPSEAEWKSLPNDPRSVTAWTLHSALEQAPQFMAQTLFVLVAVAIFVLCCGLGAAPDLSGNWAWPQRKRKVPKDLAALAPLPSAEAWLPIAIELRCKGIRSGMDEGIVTFFDGWLVFEGRRTSFALRNCDAVSLASEPTRLRLTNGSEVELIPYGVACLDEPVRRWSRSNVPDGQSLLPPTAVHPWAWGQAQGALLLGGMFVTLTALVPTDSFRALAVVALAALCGLWRMGQGLYGLTRLRSITRRRNRAPRYANATTPAGTPSSPCPPDRCGALR